jgi:hypothetical protein
MNIIINIVMYCMWAASIIAILAATFTNFTYEDLNVLAVVLLMFTLVNTYFCVAAGKKKRTGGGEPPA